jgi:hypothetical protein
VLYFQQSLSNWCDVQFKTRVTKLLVAVLVPVFKFVLVLYLCTSLLSHYLILYHLQRPFISKLSFFVNHCNPLAGNKPSSQGVFLFNKRKCIRLDIRHVQGLFKKFQNYFLQFFLTCLQLSEPYLLHWCTAPNVVATSGNSSVRLIRDRA